MKNDFFSRTRKNLISDSKKLQTRWPSDPNDLVPIPEKLLAVEIVLTEEPLPRNACIFGPTGSGKTSIIKLAVHRYVEKVRGEGRDVRQVFLLCSEFSESDYYRRILDVISPGFCKNYDNIKKQAYIEKIKEIIEASNIHLLLLLEHIENLKCPEIFGSIGQLNQDLLASSSGSITIIANAIDPLIEYHVDNKFQQYFRPVYIEFKPYSALDLIAILRQRADAFIPGALDSGVVEVCGTLASDYGGAWDAIHMLGRAGSIAEGDAVRLEDVFAVYNNMRMDVRYEYIKDMAFHQLLVFQAIVQLNLPGNPENTVPTGAVMEKYEELCKGECVSRPRVSQIISELERQGFITTNTLRGGKRGSTRDIRLTMPLDKVLSALRENPNKND